MSHRNECILIIFLLFRCSVFGKWMEDVTKHVDFELFTKNKAKKWTKIHLRKPHLIHRTVEYRTCREHLDNPDSEHCLDDGCVVGMEKKKNKVTLNKPIYIGFKVLDIAKMIMYQSFYDVFHPHFGDRMKLLAHDTDSFILEIESDDLNDDLFTLRDHMDFSNYDPAHPLFDASNKRIPGKMKNEYPCDKLEKFVGLRAKCYAVQFEDGNISKRAKGVKKSVITKELSILDYEKCLDEAAVIRRDQTLLRSKNQTIFTRTQTKVALSSLDDKRYVQECNVSTLPWGHFAIVN